MIRGRIQVAPTQQIPKWAEGCSQSSSYEKYCGNAFFGGYGFGGRSYLEPKYSGETLFPSSRNLTCG